jgi:hypothetical protein
VKHLKSNAGNSNKQLSVEMPPKITETLIIAGNRFNFSVNLLPDFDS